jgi:hypothetical protein
LLICVLMMSISMLSLRGSRLEKQLNKEDNGSAPSEVPRAIPILGETVRVLDCSADTRLCHLSATRS